GSLPCGGARERASGRGAPAFLMVVGGGLCRNAVGVRGAGFFALIRNIVGGLALLARAGVALCGRGGGRGGAGREGRRGGGGRRVGGGEDWLGGVRGGGGGAGGGGGEGGGEGRGGGGGGGGGAWVEDGDGGFEGGFVGAELFDYRGIGRGEFELLCEAAD